MERHRVAIIIPAFNEAETIEKIILELKNFGKVIVIDDASFDDTAAKAKQAGAFVIKNKINQQYDGCLNIGFNKAIEKNFEFAITVDGDGQHDVYDIPKFIKALGDKFDLVAGIRPKAARISEKIAKIIAKKKWGIEDPFCGIKGYRLSWIKRYGHFDTYSSIGTELSFRMIKDGANFTQLNVNTFDRVDHSRFGGYILANYRIIRSILLGLIFY